MSEKNEVSSKNFDEAMVKAKDAGKWLAAVWEVRDGKIALLNRTSNKFPRGDFLRVVAQLASNFSDEEMAAVVGDQPASQLPAVPEPLPRAVPDIKVFPMEEPVVEDIPPVGFPDPGPSEGVFADCCAKEPEEVELSIGEDCDTKCEEYERHMPTPTVLRTEVAVVISAEGHLPSALPAEATEEQITEAVELYRISMGAIG